MNQSMLNILITFVASSFFLVGIEGQTIYFPVDGKSTEDFNSSFGSRNLGTQEYPHATLYDYDFHAGLDIAGPENTKVLPVYSGQILKIGYSYMIIKPSNTSNVYYKYIHIVPNYLLYELDMVTGGVTELGKTDSENHLDIRYLVHNDYVDENSFGNWDYNTYNPVRKLVVNNTTSPIIVNKDGVPLSSIISLSTYEDNGTLNGNQSGKYFVLGARSDYDELDISKITV
ncbi:unnamed protein product, partial [marine sediment metagenome]